MYPRAVHNSLPGSKGKKKFLYSLEKALVKWAIAFLLKTRITNNKKFRVADYTTVIKRTRSWINDALSCSPLHADVYLPRACPRYRS